MAGTSVGLFPHAWRLILPALLLLLLPALVSCKGDVEAGDPPVLPRPVLKVGGIPDQDAARLARRYQVFTDYLSEELDVEVEYVPSLVGYAVLLSNPSHWPNRKHHLHFGLHLSPGQLGLDRPAFSCIGVSPKSPVR